jgi:hypothetical protein
VVPIDRYFLRDLPMDLLLLCYATPIKKYIKNNSAVVNTENRHFLMIWAPAANLLCGRPI